MPKGIYQSPNRRGGQKGRSGVYKRTEENKTGFKIGHGSFWTTETKKIVSEKLRGIKRGLLSDEHKRKLSDSHKGKKLSKEHKEKISLGMMGKNIWMKGRKVSDKVRLSSKKRFTGKNNPRWRGGITPENLRIRNSIETRLWREAVFARDNWTCQKYGVKGGRLVAHHIQNFSQFPDLRLAIDNGITLSDKAHREFHKKYGYKNNTREQLDEFTKR